MLTTVTRLCLIALFFYQSVNGSCQFYPYFHFAPPHGWMNDPNGFSIFKGEYQLFYQYNPVTSQAAGVANWGHAKSKDLTHWEHLPIAMSPNNSYDATGVFSGSAIEVNNTLYLLYTGNVNYPGQNPDHIQRQALAYTTDGVNVIKYEGNPVIMGDAYQPNIRDPKIWKHGDYYYMVLGNSFDNDTLGRVLLYVSEDLITWEMSTVLDASDGSLGYMWECPDFFELDGYWVLLFSPQGVKAQGDKYRNLYQTGYIIGSFNYTTLEFTPISEFKELDHGHDFYATQTMLDENGRRIMVAWFDMWENVYPERDEGWTGQMTSMRTLCLTTDLAILQKPIEEMKGVRAGLLYKGKATCNTAITLTNNIGEILIKASNNNNFELIIEGDDTKVTISYDYLNGTIALDRGGDDGIRRTEWKPTNDLQMRVFIDRSSIELFCGLGEVTFSSRFFPSGEVKVTLGDTSEAEKFLIYNMKRTIPIPNLSCASSNE